MVARKVAPGRIVTGMRSSCIVSSERPLGYGSAQGHALGVHVDRVERLAARHEEPVPLDSAEAEIGAALGEEDATEQLALGVEDGDAVLALAPAPATPEVALPVAAHAVGD